MNGGEQNDTEDNPSVVSTDEISTGPMNNAQQQVLSDDSSVEALETTFCHWTDSWPIASEAPSLVESDDDEEWIIFEEMEDVATCSEPTVPVAKCTEPTVLPYKQHVRDVTNLTVPVILSMLFQNAMPMVDLAFVGNLGKDELAAAALATVWFNLWNAAMLGFVTAIPTFLSQSYGAQNYTGFGIWTGNSLVIVFFCTILMSGIIAVCGPVMKLFGQDRDLADAAGEFSYILVPGLFPLYLFMVLIEFLQTQDRLAPGVVVGILANGVNFFLNWYLIFHRDLGLNGAPWATTLTRTIQFILIAAYLVWSKSSFQRTVTGETASARTGVTSTDEQNTTLFSTDDDDANKKSEDDDINKKSEDDVQNNDDDMDGIIVSTWPQFDRAYMTRDVLRPFWNLGITGALAFSAESWSFEGTTILAGLLGTTSLDAHVVTMSVVTFIYMSFPYAIGIAACIRVGQLMGDQRPEDARRSYHTSTGLACVTQGILIGILWPCRYIIADWFSIDEDVSHLVAELIPISCVFMMADTVQATIGGVLRGMGQHKMVLYLNILAYWVIALPIGCVLTFVVGLGVEGLWWGYVIGLYLVALITYLYVKFRINWEGEAELALKRVSIFTENDTADPTTSTQQVGEFYKTRGLCVSTCFLFQNFGTQPCEPAQHF